ncbi:MAG: hypothetical protein KA354_02080 [Phycisphaerae bacterium]|nr:hypothetical protein [Phycisphaerae bacterium]
MSKSLEVTPVRVTHRSDLGHEVVGSVSVKPQVRDAAARRDTAELSSMAGFRGYPAIAGLLLLALSFSGYYLGYAKGYTAGAQQTKTIGEPYSPEVGDPAAQPPADAWTISRLEPGNRTTQKQ